MNEFIINNLKIYHFLKKNSWCFWILLEDRKELPTKNQSFKKYILHLQCCNILPLCIEIFWCPNSKCTYKFFPSQNQMCQRNWWIGLTRLWWWCYSRSLHRLQLFLSKSATLNKDSLYKKHMIRLEAAAHSSSFSWYREEERGNLRTTHSSIFLWDISRVSQV